MRAAVVDREEGSVTLRFDREGAAFAEALRQAGALALPPYIARPTGPTAADASDYQTVFAREEGAVAAPTGGLHFTPALLARLEQAGIRIAPPSRCMWAPARSCPCAATRRITTCTRSAAR